MAKKVVATLKTGKGKEYSKVITMAKSPRTGAYSFKEQIVHNDHIKDAIMLRKVLIGSERYLKAVLFKQEGFFY